MSNELTSAIQQKKTVKFNYDGGAVIVEPFCYGTSADGKEALKGFLVAGGENGWKIFDASKIKDVKLTNVSFGLTRPDFKPDEGMKSIQCKVS
jgi:hypothetical protein